MTRGPSATKRLSAAIILMALQLALILPILSVSAAGPSITGVVVDDKGEPIGGASVSAWLKTTLIASAKTGEDGAFSLEVKSEARHAVYAQADDDSTPGVDYLPGRAEASASENGSVRFVLPPAASLFMEGDIQIVESEELPITVSYTPLDASTGEALMVGGQPLVYGNSPGSLTGFLGLGPSHLVVPADLGFRVETVCSLLQGSRLITHSFRTDGPAFRLAGGEAATVDVRRYSVPFNIGLVDQLQGRVGSAIEGMEALGFYLVSERASTSASDKLLAEARSMFDEGRQTESFGSAKRAYLVLRNTMTGLEGMYRDATVSVYILVIFLGLTSMGVASLVSNREATRLLVALITYAAELGVLLIVYPGVNLVARELLLGSAALSFVSVYTVAVLAPRFLKGHGGGAHVPLRNILVPVLSLAKRNILRRRLRFTLTLTSITVLVMSFVALTSFSQGYGLLVNRVTAQGAPGRGVIIRAQGYTAEETVFMWLTVNDRSWLEGQPESGVVSLRMENFPQLRPIVTLNEAEIFGVVGVDPETEVEIVDLGGALVQGGLQSEGGVLVSARLAAQLGADVGERLTLGSLQVTLEGVFDDNAFAALRDLDGSPYLPRKFVNTAPPGEPPDLEVAVCEPSEVVVTDPSTASRMPFVGLARIGIALEGGTSDVAFAERLALERGYQAWAASPEGIYYATLGGYAEGKGFSLAIPWGIVVLNVVVMVLNSMFERRREIGILSSVGLNPAQIASIFVSEASLVGLVAGGVGYLLGLSLYRAMTFFRVALEVHQKVSAVWSVASISVAMAAVLVGALIALRSSVVITPSLMRRWRIEGKRGDISAPFEFQIPLRLLPEETEAFEEYLVRSLRALEDDQVRCTANIKASGDRGRRLIEFLYKGVHMGAGNFYTRNAIFIEVRGGEASVGLRSYGEENWAHVVGSLLRQIAMEWSTIRAGTRASGDA